MRVLIVGDFQRDLTRFMLNNSRKFSKGFTRNGHHVLEFSYRNMLMQLSPLPSRRWAAWLAKGKTDRLLAKLAQHHQTDLVLITAFRLLDAVTVQRLKQAVPHAQIVCWYGDMQQGTDPHVAAIGRQCDWFLATSAGSTLRNYHALGIEHCAFMPNPADADVERRYQVPDHLRSRMLFVGKLKHSGPGQDPARWELIQRLVAQQQLTVWGSLGRPTLKGLDYLQAICGTDMALSVNAYNDVRMYHSDRLIHLTGCGAFVLAKRVPDSDLLFEDGKHLCYFDSYEQCVELIERYADDAQARAQIAAAGMAHAHREFAAQKLARHIVELIEHGTFVAPWAEII